MKIDPYYQWQKDSSGFVDFSHVQIVHKFAGRVTPNLEFKVTIFFQISCLENDKICVEWQTDKAIFNYLELFVTHI